MVLLFWCCSAARNRESALPFESPFCSDPPGKVHVGTISAIGRVHLFLTISISRRWIASGPFLLPVVTVDSRLHVVIDRHVPRRFMSVLSFVVSSNPRSSSFSSHTRAVFVCHPTRGSFATHNHAHATKCACVKFAFGPYTSHDAPDYSGSIISP